MTRLDEGDIRGAWQAYWSSRAHREHIALAGPVVERLVYQLVAHGGAWTQLETLLHLERLGPRPVPTAPFLAAVEAATCGGHIAVARRLCENHSGRRIRHNDYHQMLRAAAQDHLPEAMAVLRDMSQHGRPPSTDSYSILLRGRVAAGRLEEAEQVLTFLEGDGSAPPAGLYNHLLRAYETAGKLDDCERMLSRMGGRGVAFCRTTYDIAIALFASQRRLDEALDVYRQLLDDHLRLSPGVFNLLLQAAAVDGHLAVHQLLLDHAPMHGMGRAEVLAGRPPSPRAPPPPPPPADAAGLGGQPDEG